MTGERVALRRTAAVFWRAIAWLCSPEASYVTGTTLPVDGGYLVE